MTTLSRIICVIALCAPASALAQAFEIELGLRFEQLTLDGDFEFTCDCDPEEDPGCDTDPNFCSAGQIDDPHEGYLVGGFAGLMASGSTWSAGIRLAATFGDFDPVDGGANAESQGLFHVTGEVPIEAHLRLPATELFAQVVPRLGFLNLGQEDGGAESPDTTTFGVLLMAGVRFGGDARVGAAVGRVQHPSISGWAVDAAVRFGVTPEGDMPGPEAVTPAEVPSAPVAPDRPAVPAPITPNTPKPPAAPTAPEG